MEAPDREHRDRARLTLDASVVVEAGAGTGKTTLLTDRILFLVLAGERPARVEEVVALTFTEKAAGEIKVRLSERLGELAALLAKGVLSPAGEERARRTLGELSERFGTGEADVLARARAALEDLDKAPIGTIHSFCSRILRLYPVEAGVDPAFAVDADESAFKELFVSEWAKWLDVELGERPPRQRAWLELLAAADLGEIEALARELAAERFDLERVGKPDPQSAAALRAMAERLERLPNGRPKARGKILEAVGAAAARLRAAADAAAAELPPLDAPELPEPPGSKWPSNWEDEGGQADFLKAALELSEAASPRGEALARRAVALVLPFVIRFRRDFARRGWVSHDGLLMRARDLLRDHVRPREELKRRYRTLLIDEFQDTDPVQGELLLYLSEAHGRGSRSWKDVLPAPGRIFVVGDPKQSIYRFRGADIAAYEGFLSRLAEGGALSCDLTANFRSTSGVIEPINGVFSEIMRAEAGIQPAYKAIQPGKAAAPGASGPAVAIVSMTSSEKGVGAPETRRAEAAWVSDKILSTGRPFKDYAILLRSSTALPALLDAFRSSGIPYAVEIERDFYDAGEINDLLNLLRALDSPEDRIAVAGLLRSPLAALSDDGVLALARAGALGYRRDPAPGVLPEDERRAASRLFEALRSLRARAGRQPLGEFVADAIRETRLIELAAKAYHGQQTVSNLVKIQRKAAEASDSRGTTLKEFIGQVADAKEKSKREGESPLADEHLDAVRILTMHKSKGLEFPVVFGVNLSAKTNKAAKKPSARQDWRTGATVVRVGRSKSPATALSEAREKTMEHQESIRLLYVAMTRAKETLYLLGRDEPDSSSLAAHLEKAGEWGGAGRIPVLSVDIAEAGAKKPARAPRAPAAVDAAAAAKSWAAREALRAGSDAPRARAATAYLAEAPKRPAPPGEEARSPAGAELGQICHLALQGWDFAKGGDAAAACASARRLLERRAPGPRWAEAEREAAKVLGVFTASKAAKELAKAEILGREVPFAYADGATVVRGAADLVYRMGGKLVVADYKSEKADAASAAKARAKYAEQGRAYQEAVRLAWGETAEFRLLFLRAPDL